eukprot:TRINITY_DN636_c0_g1_i1.p1 TRINITY_DN636_c0_g1~~TRINITY_DN636_c0_g1_i1.p1  ORF type:complete len:215 (+),score=57.73 TRINITY_DN636_c0_g1_i1:690-1334(+)
MGSIPGWVIALVKKKSAEQWMKLSDYMHTAVLPKRAFEQAAEEEEAAARPAPAPAGVTMDIEEAPLAPVEPSTRQPSAAATKRRRVLDQDDEESSSDDENVAPPVKKSRRTKRDDEEYHDSWAYDVSNQETLRQVESLLIRLDANVAVLNHRITLLQSPPVPQHQQPLQQQPPTPARSDRARLGWRILTMLFAWPVIVVLLYHFFMRRRLRLRK